MYSLKANWLNEMEKLWARRKTKVFLLLSILIPAASAAVLANVQNASALVAGFGADLPMLMLSLFTALLLPLFLFMMAVESFAGEIAERTIKLVLVRPVSRAKVFASKVLALAAYAIIHLGAVGLASVLAGLFVNRSLQWSSLLESIVAYGVAFVPMITVALIAVLIAQSMNNSIGALALILFLYIFAKLLPFIFPSVAVWSAYSYTNWHTLWIGSGVSPTKLFTAFGILLSYCIMAYAGSMMMFERKRF
ncbi:ABC transporter permease [Paenibacillus sp. GCM10027626]|uniref:ABC transporter permease n=1 Tax=Paenibacillus sp. GCM10027626 TaxID=3273411 RepID=UPI00362CFCFE